MILVLLVLLGLIAAIAGAIWLFVMVLNWPERGPRPSLKTPVILVAAGILWMLWMRTGAVQVPAIHMAVVENTITGTFTSLGPGTHIFPFTTNVIPFVTNITQYDLRRQMVEIGEPQKEVEFRKTAIEADSNSPGRPSVYFHARGWAYPNKAKIIELHRRYGPDYLDHWVEKVWIATLKSVQGQKEYFYVGQHRVDFQEDVEKRMQGQLLDEDDEALVFISQLAVVNFDFTDATKQYLQSVQKVEFDRQQAEQQIQVNQKQQEADRIRAETSYIVETRNAERDRDAKIARANGDAEATKINAAAERYRIEQTYTAEAEGVRKVQVVLANAPQGYLEYQKTKQWNGQLPQYMLGGSNPLPFVDLTPPRP